MNLPVKGVCRAAGNRRDNTALNELESIKKRNI